MKEGVELLNEFDTTYYKKTKHRKKCKVCGKLIQDGESVTMAKIRIVKSYPIKGLMGFIRWCFKHSNCKGNN